MASGYYVAIFVYTALYTCIYIHTHKNRCVQRTIIYMILLAVLFSDKFIEKKSSVYFTACPHPVCKPYCCIVEQYNHSG